MWPLQRKNKHSLLHKMIRLGLYSGLGHCIVFFLLLFVYKGDTVLRFDLCATRMDADIPVVMVPWRKRMHAGPIQMPQKKSHASSAPSKTNTTVVASKKVQQKNEKVTTLASLAPSKPKKKEKNDAAKKTEVAAIDPVKKIEKEEKIIKEAEVPKPEPVAELEKNETAKSEVVAQAQGSGPVNAPEALMVGTEEMAQLQMQENLQKELCTRWRPPLGLRPDLVCEVNIYIDWDGSVKKVSVSKSSGVPLYDMSARQALATFNPPSWAKGKEITICFKQ